MNRVGALLLAALVVTGPLAGAQSGPSTRVARSGQGNDLFQKALSKERAEGQLAEAIQIYLQIVKDFASDRPLAAKALLQVGRGYDKLGKADARPVYERLLREYADQKEVVTEARARLAALGPAPAVPGGIVTRRVLTTNARTFFGSVSPDGRSVVAYPPSGDLVLRDLSDGTDRLLVKRQGSREGAGTLWSVFAPSARQVVYTWFNGTRYDLRVVGVGGTGSETPRVLYANDDVDWIGPYDWSPDGKWIAVQLRRHDRTAQIGLVSAADGSLRILKSVDWQGSSQLSFSRDGQYLAFDLPADGGAGTRDIFLLATDGSREAPAVVAPSNDLVVGWTPDGQHLLFISDGSDRFGSMALWALPVRAGKPSGTFSLVKPDVGNNQLFLGLTRAGSLYFATRIDSSVLSIASVDPASGTIPASAPIEQINAGSSPAWSPDGKYLAYMSNAGMQGAVGAGRGELVAVAIRTLDTGQTRHLHPRLVYFKLLQWSPDGRSVIGQGTDGKGREGVFRVDAETGAADAIVVGTGQEAFFWPQWLPDGKRIVYLRMLTNLQGDRTIVTRDVDSGDERELLRRGGDLRLPFAVSPDGRHLAAATYDRVSRQSAVLLLPLEGGPSRELLRVEGPPAIVGIVGWTPDSRTLIFGKAEATPGSWWLSLDEGSPRKVDFNGAGADGFLQVHPDGKRIVFQVSAQTPPQVWVLENFLPAVRPPASPQR